MTPAPKPTFTKADSVLKPGADYTAVITTSKGDFTIDFVTDKSPNTTNSFIFLAERGFYDGLPFTVSRGVTASDGDPAGDGSGGPGYTTAYESSGLTNKRGTLAMIPAPSSSFLRVRQFGSQFYINLKDNVLYDTGGIAADIRPPFATVTKGMEIVDALATGDRIVKIAVIEKAPGTTTPFVRPTVSHPLIINTPTPSR